MKSQGHYSEPVPSYESASGKSNRANKSKIPHKTNENSRDYKKKKHSFVTKRQSIPEKVDPEVNTRKNVSETIEISPSMQKSEVWGKKYLQPKSESLFEDNEAVASNLTENTHQYENHRMPKTQQRARKFKMVADEILMLYDPITGHVTDERTGQLYLLTPVKRSRD